MFALSTQQSNVQDGDVKAKTAFGIVSHCTTHGMDPGLDNPNDELAVASLRRMKEDERHRFKPIGEGRGRKGRREQKAQSRI